MSEFHFVVARITAAQICRSAGIERSSASVLDALTAIMLDFLTMLGTAASSATEARGADEADISDAVLAAAQCGAVRGPPVGDITSMRDIDELLQWIGGTVNQRMTELARPQRVLNAQYAANLPHGIANPTVNAPTNSHVPDLAGSAIVQAQSSEPQPLNFDRLEDGLGAASYGEHMALLAPLDHANQTSNDWLRAVICRQSAMGYLDFNESLGSNREPDFVIHGL